LLSPLPFGVAVEEIPGVEPRENRRTFADLIQHCDRTLGADLKEKGGSKNPHPLIGVVKEWDQSTTAFHPTRIEVMHNLIYASTRSLLFCKVFVITSRVI